MQFGSEKQPDVLGLKMNHGLLCQDHLDDGNAKIGVGGGRMDQTAGGARCAPTTRAARTQRRRWTRTKNGSKERHDAAGRLGGRGTKQQDEEQMDGW